MYGSCKNVSDSPNSKRIIRISDISGITNNKKESSDTDITFKARESFRSNRPFNLSKKFDMPKRDDSLTETNSYLNTLAKRINENKLKKETEKSLKFPKNLPLEESPKQQKDSSTTTNNRNEIRTSICSGSSSANSTQSIQPSTVKKKLDKVINNEVKKENIRVSENAFGEELASLCVSDESACSKEKIVPVKLPQVLKVEPKVKPKRESLKATPVLKASLFSNVSPTIYFGTSSEKILPLPTEIRNQMLWKLSPITPKLISQAVLRSGFRLTKDAANWVSTWGQHLKCNQFKFVRATQKINHFPGTFHLGRKDRLWLNIVKMQNIHGQSAFSFMPETYILPQDFKKLRQVWQEETQMWIVKPPASARGIGVTVICKWSDIPKETSVVVQKYISEPFLINGSKFDLRIYVLVTCFDPLRIYVFDDGLVRFASVQYSRALNSIGEKFMHLTNYSINRKNSSYKVNESEKSCQGHKWSLKSLWGYLKRRHVDTERLWSSITDIVIKTIISTEDAISKLVKVYSKNRYSCYELFGFDIIFDHSLKPWLLEVNISPSLHSNSQLDVDIKGQLIKDMFNTAGFQIPEHADISSEAEKEMLKMCSIREERTTKLRLNTQLYNAKLSDEEKIKHSRYEQRNLFEKTILKDLTPDDVRCLIESEDELARCGHFIRVFPSRTSSLYLKYMEKTKYYNLLLDAWEKRFQRSRKTGIELLQILCNDDVHLQFTVVVEAQKMISIYKPDLVTKNPEEDATFNNNNEIRQATAKIFAKTLDEKEKINKEEIAGVNSFPSMRRSSLKLKLEPKS